MSTSLLRWVRAGCYSLVAVAGFSLRQVIVTKAAGSASSSQADRSYDGIESLRDRQSATSAKSQVEGLTVGFPKPDALNSPFQGVSQIRNTPATAEQGGQCKDDERSYQLSNGQWVR